MQRKTMAQEFVDDLFRTFPGLDRRNSSQYRDDLDVNGADLVDWLNEQWETLARIQIGQEYSSKGVSHGNNDE